MVSDISRLNNRELRKDAQSIERQSMDQVTPLGRYALPVRGRQLRLTAPRSPPISFVRRDRLPRASVASVDGSPPVVRGARTGNARASPVISSTHVFREYEGFDPSNVGGVGGNPLRWFGLLGHGAG